MEISTVFEDEYLLVVNKPSGIVVNRANTVKEKTVQDWIEEKFKDKFKRCKEIKKNNYFLARSGIVHRLDKETSGLLIIAKNNDTFINLISQFAERKIKKTYLALVHNYFSEKQGIISVPIKRSPYNRLRFTVFIGGKRAYTKYAILDRFEFYQKKFSLVKLYPSTGRTHQLRVHLKYINHPIVADEIYLGKRLYLFDITFCPRLFLHATRLKFHHPESNVLICLNLDLPADLKSVLDKLTKAN